MVPFVKELNLLKSCRIVIGCRYVHRRRPDHVVRLGHQLILQLERLSLELEEVHEDLEGRDVVPGGQVEDGRALQRLVLVGVVLDALREGYPSPRGRAGRFKIQPGGRIISHK